MRILIDMDGVIADFEGGFLQEWRKRYPHRPYVPLEQRKTFQVIEEYPNHEKSVSRIFKSRGFFLSLKPIEGSIQSINEMSSLGLEIFICSSPLNDYRHCVMEKYAWVEKHLGSPWVRKLILAKDKTIIDADILIDDKPRIAGATADPTWEHVIYDQPYNRDETDKRRLTWNNWREVLIPNSIPAVPRGRQG